MPVPPRVTVYQSVAIDGTGCAVFVCPFAAWPAVLLLLGNAWRDDLQMISLGHVLTRLAQRHCTLVHKTRYASRLT